MRKMSLAVLSAAALAACNPSGQSGTTADGGASGGGFPNLFQAAYRAEFSMTNPETGASTPGVMIRDGQKLRLEMNAAGGSMVMIRNPETGEIYSIMSGGGRQIATRVEESAFNDPLQDWSGSDSVAAATPAGPCSAAGENGQSWTVTNEEGTSTTCVTSDGIILSATNNGQVTWQTTAVERGPQNAALFQLPPGVQVMDFSNMGNVAEMMEKMKGATGN